MTTEMIQPNQTYLDAVMNGCGTMEAAMTVMLANEKSLTDDASIGQAITVPDGVITDKNVLEYFTRNQVVAGTRG